MSGLNTLGRSGNIVLKAKYDFKKQKISTAPVSVTLEKKIRERAFGANTLDTIIEAVNQYFSGSYSSSVTKVDDKRIVEFITKTFPTMKEVYNKDLEELCNRKNNDDLFRFH